MKDTVTSIYHNIKYPAYIEIPFYPGVDENPYPAQAIDYTYDGLYPSDRGSKTIADMMIGVFKKSGY